MRVVNRIVPLAPTLAIRIRPDLTVDRQHTDFSFGNFSRRRRNVTLKEIIEINRLIVRCGEDVIFYRDDAPWTEKFLIKNRNFRVEPTTRKVHIGSGSLMVSTVRVLPHTFPPTVTTPV